MIRRVAFAQGEGDPGGFRKTRGEFAGNFPMAGNVDLAALHGAAFRVDAEDVGGVFLVADDDVGILNNLFHAFRCEFLRGASAFPAPQFFTEVQIAGDFDSPRGGFPDDGKGCLERFFAEGRSDAGHMEVFAVFQHRSKVVILRSALGDYRVGAVVDHV